MGVFFLKKFLYLCNMEKHKTKVDWVLDQHKNTNHMYDKYLPYEFHLRMVVNVYEKYKYLLEKHHGLIDNQTNVYLACWGHDLIEDTRVSYNDVKTHLGQESADIIYSVTNEKGKNRKERGNDKYYEGIRNTPGGVFVKLCDRIANVQYSKMTGSRMFEMYQKENIDFMVKLGREVGNPYEEMYQYLINLFEN
jgi:(p)ppGpp synthase/HD superfamily hydrolase